MTDELIAYIGVRGPITVAEFMRRVLRDGRYGYYTSKGSRREQVIGAAGDFITAPEVSQLFGESLLVWLMTQYQSLGSPAKIQLIEIGPGKGTLICDIVRSGEKRHKVCVGVHLVEVTNGMRSRQKESIRNLQKETSVNVISFEWHDVLSSVPIHDDSGDPIPTFVICQELVDALPIHSFQKIEGNLWRERLVDVAIRDDSEASDAAKDVHLAVAPPSDDNHASTSLNSLPVGSIIEACPEGLILVQDIADRIQNCNGGAALIIDYGENGASGGDTLRGFWRHTQVHPLSRPGEVDVTADVDFGALREAVNRRVTFEDSFERKRKENAYKRKGKTLEEDANENDKPDNKSTPPITRQYEAYGPITQGQFLASMGIVERVERYIEDDDTTDEQAYELFSALERLVGSDEMGERYKVLAIAAAKKDGLFPPPGF
ncbi:predicted protein [Thalassiosira pseudonana CCMP1335]|uniref:Protein arginine methyltransferase NDUFAF7 n=1 Tax=Thalassiosira pseudonana TaxID=35128 RepID=B8BT56_THAPS|nr:predicted protein [Thalassiosira pseudonana CCMP1335]EED95661.1 predicted protein [Thalassiosira pseudonana CCMP1335]